MKDLYTETMKLQSNFNRGICKFSDKTPEDYTKHLHEELSPDYRDCLKRERQDRERIKKFYGS